MLFLSSQHIHRIEIGMLSKNGELEEQVFVSCPPENFLGTLNTLLSAWGKAWHDFDRVIVVTGPGSFTSTRGIVAIANSIGFTQSIPVVGIENPDEKTLSEMVSEDVWVKNVLDSSDLFANVAYGRGPGITMSKKWHINS